MAAYGNETTLNMKRFVYRAVIDVGCVCLVAAPVLVINLEAEPVHRGFFCDDQSLMHPYLEDTVPLWVLIICAIFLPIICILLVENLQHRTASLCDLAPTIEMPSGTKSRVEASYKCIVVFLLGASVTQLMTEIGKTSVGRLRPHFLDLCRPAHEPQNCSSMFLTEAACTGTDAERLREARLSFPSGHASMAMYAASFLVVYLQSRLVCLKTKLLRPVIQVLAITSSFFTCLSRISDYKHHWSDVLAGGLLGIIVCYLVVISLRDYHHSLLLRPYEGQRMMNRNERLPMCQQDVNASCSSDMPTDQDAIRIHCHDSLKL